MQFLRNVSSILLAFLLTVPLAEAGAATGDTTHVQVHNATDLTWNGNYDRWGLFPDGSTTYNRIILVYTMGCSSAQCSDWDYTTNVEIMYRDGTIDSTISGFDTLSTSPLVIDTLWNVFDVRESFELGRAITPYGGYMADGTNGFDNSWTRTFAYDVTDFAMMLKDSVEIRVHFGGWQNGFSASTDFYFIEGTPRMDVVSIRNVYNGSWGYADSVQFETNGMPAKTMSINPAHRYKLRVTPSGHGFDNSTNCAEFCERDYRIDVNGSVAAQQSMWRDDCGMNAVYPQGGTWVYNRANWCPGDYVWTFQHDITDYIGSGPTATIDMSITPAISWTGNQQPSYIMDCILIEYTKYAYDLDAGIEEIRAPSAKANYLRYNPICDNPIIVIKNHGSKPLWHVDIEYGVLGGKNCWYEWTGALYPEESVEVILPTFDWSGMLIQQFFARIQFPNRWWDANPLNDELRSNFHIPPQYDSVFVVRMQTNSAANENEWFVYDEEGAEVAARTNMQNNSVYWDTVSLSAGCYTFVLNDHDPNFGGGDGLAWWANSDGSGSIQLRDLINSTSIASIFEAPPSDFGSQVRLPFMVGYDLGDGPGKPACVKPVHNPVSIGSEPQEDQPFRLYPNPASDWVTVELDFENAEVSLYDANGRLIDVRSSVTASVGFDLSKIPSQLLVVRVSDGVNIYQRRLVHVSERE